MTLPDRRARSVRGRAAGAGVLALCIGLAGLSALAAGPTAPGSGAPTGGSVTAAAPALRIAPASVAVAALRPARSQEAAEARLTLEGVAVATGRHEQSVAAARAALVAVQAALTSPAPVPADVRAQLVARRGTLLLLVRAAPTPEAFRAGALRSVGPASVAEPTLLDDLAAAERLRDLASEVFALAREGDDPAGVGIAAADGVPAGDLAVLDLLLADATALAAVLPADLLPLDTGERPEWMARVTGTSRWGQPNGSVPLDELCVPQTAPAVLLDCSAAAALDLLAAAYRADTGRDLGVVSGYRTYAEQVALRAARGGLAAVPGTSMHGIGLAVDLADAGALGQYSAPVYLWLAEHAATYGWHHPAAMGPGGGGPPEPWHWEFVG